MLIRFWYSEASYRYHFKRWGWRKNVASSIKDIVLQKAHRRARQGKSTTVLVDGSKVDAKIIRHAKAEARKEHSILDNSSRLADHQYQVFGKFLPFGNRIFVNWTVPLAAGRSKQLQSLGKTPPSSDPTTTSEGVIVRTPTTACDSPMHLDGLHNEPSSMADIVSEAILLNRTRLFSQGRFDELAMTMDDVEKITISNWLYQLWLFAFKVSKSWNKEACAYRKENLDFVAANATTLQHCLDSPDSIPSSSQNACGRGPSEPEKLVPSQLCRWSVHVDDDHCEFIYDTRHNETDDSRSEPPPAPIYQSLEEQIQNAIEKNNFSNIPTETVPLSLPQIVRSVKRSPKELLLEAFSFSIMSRNEGLVYEIIGKLTKEKLDVKGTYPLHMATSYLDGGSTCCNILDILCQSLPNLVTIYTNDYGHTVIDNLMLTILKAHSSCTLSTLDDTLPQDSRFAGAEVDICGRWDADSPCYRTRLESGIFQVPQNWKHRFCHTSILAICHCIDSLQRIGLGTESTKLSGLFVKRCFNCGLSLHLSPLHALVLTAFHLAKNGCEGEDLFGMIAVLLCMLSNQIDPCTRAAISIDLLLGVDDETECTHEDLRPIDLAEKLPPQIVEGWSPELKRGWQIFCHILRPYDEASEEANEHSSNTHTKDQTPFACCDSECYDYWDTYSRKGSRKHQFALRRDIGHIWAAIQTELLTYRRIKESDPWISEYFDCDALLTALQTGGQISMPLLDQDMIKPHCRCGKTQGPFMPVLRERIANSYFSNMDVWDRTSFIAIPVRFM